MDTSSLFFTIWESAFPINSNVIINIIFAILLLIFGVLLSKVLVYLLGRLFIKLELKNKIRESFISLLLNIIRWSIYIIFIDLALKQLNIPLITGIITKIIIVIPAITSALLLIAIGTAIAFYLREIIEDSEVLGWKMISMYFFYFILYVFGVYSLKIALISIETFFVNILIAILTFIIVSAIAYVHIKNSLREKQIH